MILYQPTVLEYTFERLLQMKLVFFILNRATNQSSNNSMLLLFLIITTLHVLSIKIRRVIVTDREEKKFLGIYLQVK
jgi:hypothetical protein